MKRSLLLALFFFLFMAVHAQQKEQPFDKNNIKILTSEQEEEVKVKIRKPDESSIMPRKDTDFESMRSLKIKQKIKNSNKMLY